MCAYSLCAVFIHYQIVCYIVEYTFFFGFVTAFSTSFSFACINAFYAGRKPKKMRIIYFSYFAYMNVKKALIIPVELLLIQSEAAKWQKQKKKWERNQSDDAKWFAFQCTTLSHLALVLLRKKKRLLSYSIELSWTCLVFFDTDDTWYRREWRNNKHTYEMKKWRRQNGKFLKIKIPFE